MAEPWTVAEEAMVKYFADKGQEWPGAEAHGLLETIRLGRDHRWVAPAMAMRAENVLNRSTFDVDDFVEYSLGITIAFDRLEHLDASQGAPVYGCAYPHKREIVICERATQYMPLYRSTVIHEAGHVLLHSDPACRCLLYVPGRPASTPEEREANQFMQAALLPKSVLLLGVGYLCHCWGINVRLALGSANTQRGRWIWRERLLGPLSSHLCVSRQMICLMLRQIGAFSQESLLYHRSYRLATRWHSPAPEGTLSLHGIQYDLSAFLATVEA